MRSVITPKTRSSILSTTILSTILSATLLSSTAWGALGNTVVIYGMTTGRVIANNYISVKDNFNQTRIYPKEWLEKGYSNKIKNGESSLVFKEIDVDEYNKLADDCQASFKNKKSNLKMCPTKI